MRTSFFTAFVSATTVRNALLASAAVNEEQDDSAISNRFVDYKQCSSGDKEWHICFDGWDKPQLYCPTVLEFNLSQVNEIGYATCCFSYTGCFTCPNDDSNCETVVIDVLQLHNISLDTTLFWERDISSRDDDIDDSFINYYNSSVLVSDALIGSCQRLCDGGTEDDECSSNNDCTPSSHFCDFTSDEDFALNASGSCKACPSDVNDCFGDDIVTSTQGKQNCYNCRLNCDILEDVSFTLGEESFVVGSPIGESLEIAIQKTNQYVTGPLEDCSNLLLENEFHCSGAEGSVCLVDRSEFDDHVIIRTAWELNGVAKDSGCVAIVDTDQVWMRDAKIDIPHLFLWYNQSLGNKLGDPARVEVQMFGHYCWDPHDFPYADFPGFCNSGGFSCGENEYCSLDWGVVDGEFTEGSCKACPTFNETGEPDPAGCFFERAGDDWYLDYQVSFLTPEAIRSCAVSCNASLVSKDCKFCPSEISALNFGVDDEADQCFFCPNSDVRHPDRIVPLFGEDITCSMIQNFFNRFEVHKESQNCRLVQSMNYICGCKGTGYAGANTDRKQVVLVWLPRVSAILSLMGSLFIIYDTMRTRSKRKKLQHQLLSTLSVFDILGSIAYSLTTLPTPESDYLYGAKGNEKTCTAQGFFIQVGTIACFLNVSLAAYYLLTIKHGWTDEKFNRTHAKYALFIPPIAIGLAFAFAGIPFYDNVRVWCNNSAKWWPEIPVIVAIIAATAIMGALCHSVYSNERRSARYTRGTMRQSMRVLKQSCWFIVAFFITWVPYLTLQYMLSSGRGYDNYGLILSAATLVPLQGFWNSFVYIRPRYLRYLMTRVRTNVARTISTMKSRMSSKPKSTEHAASGGSSSLPQSTRQGENAICRANEDAANRENALPRRDDAGDAVKNEICANEKGQNKEGVSNSGADGLEACHDD